MKKIAKGTLSLVAVIAITLAVRIILGIMLRPAAPVLSSADATLFERARQLHHDALVVDAHDDVLTYIVDHGYDLAMNRMTEVFFFTTVFRGCLFRQVALTLRQIWISPEFARVAWTLNSFQFG